MSITSVILQHARELAFRYKLAFSSPREWRDVSPEQFPHLDLKYYDELTTLLVGQGFRHVVDVEDVTGTRLSPDFRTFQRWMIGNDGEICAVIEHLRSGGGSRLLRLDDDAPTSMRLIDFTSEFSDGTFLESANDKGLIFPHEIPGLTRHHHPKYAEPLQLLKEHRRALAAISTTNPTISTVRYVTRNDVAAGIERSFRRLSDFRRSIGYVTLEELRWISQDRLPTSVIRSLHAEVQDVLARELEND
jgi:hypothetical protein